MIDRDDFRRGAEAAASVADGYNASSTHPHRLGDCILAKMNLRARDPRRNRQRAEDRDQAWLRGFASALAEVHRLLVGGNDSVNICRIAREAGLTLSAAHIVGVSSYDLKELKKAGIQ